jgi:hypothetical protein
MPIDEFSSELKAYIKRHWVLYETQPEQAFDSFLQTCIDAVGAKGDSAGGHFRHAGVAIEEYEEDSS